MRESLWNKRMPTLFGLLMLVIGVAATSMLTRNQLLFVSRASPGNSPTNIRITNISENAFTVSYTTSDSVPGIIAYGTTPSVNQTTTDDKKSQQDTLASYTSHHITIKNLSPETKYFFNITSGSETFLNNDSLFEITTAPNTSSLPSTKATVSGKVIGSDGKPTLEGIVYLTTDNGQTLSTFTQQDGSYTIPLASLRTKDFISYASLNENTILKLLIVGNNSKSNTSVFLKDASPVPLITLSQDYDFTASISPVASSSAQIGFPSLSGTSTSGNQPEITSPKKDQTLTDQKPIFRGTAQPNTNVTITIHSEESIEEKVTSDSRGNWSFRPIQPLSAGQHTITITTRDKFGILKTISQQFTVHASGSTVSQTATPSATPKTETTPTPTITPTPTLTVVNPTILPSQPPVGGQITTAPKGGVVLEPGTSSTTLGIGALITTATGILLLFLSNGASSL